jgi:cyanate permease
MHDIYTVPMKAVWFTRREEMGRGCGKRQATYCIAWVPSLLSDQTVTHTNTHLFLSFLRKMGVGAQWHFLATYTRKKNQVPIVLGWT